MQHVAYGGDLYLKNGSKLSDNKPPVWTDEESKTYIIHQIRDLLKQVEIKLKILDSFPSS